MGNGLTLGALRIRHEMRIPKTFSSVAIIGPGRIGQAMGRLLAQAGVPIACVAARRRAAAKRAVEFIRMGKAVGLADLKPESASIFLITTADAAVAAVAHLLARQGHGKRAWKGKVVLHTCGSLTSSALRPLKLRGAATGSLHPFQTVPSPQAGVRNLHGGFWGLEGDRQALRKAKQLVNFMAGVNFPVRPGKKTLYHLSAFIVCPTVVTLMAQAMNLLKLAGVPAKVARPMLLQFVAQTAGNFSDLGPRRALTGPVVRGDWATIRRHQIALRKSAPEFVPVYQSLLKEMLRLAGSFGVPRSGMK